MAVGQHIYVERPKGWMTKGMFHHGVDLGDGTVVHFTGVDKKDAKVIRTSFLNFEKNGTAKAFPYETIIDFAGAYFGEEVAKAISRGYYKHGAHVPPPRYDSEGKPFYIPAEGIKVVESALGWLETTFKADSYHPAHNNCEHFASYCVGHRFSLQVQYEIEFLRRKPTIGGLASAALTELRRFRLNPQASTETKDGWYYTGTKYKDEISNKIYREYYQFTPKEKRNFFPRWYSLNENISKYEIVDVKQVPYPLIPLVNCYVRKGSKKEIKAQNYTV